MSLTDELTATAYVAGWRLVRLLPERAARAAFDRIADRIHAADGSGVRRLRANLARLGVTDEADVRAAVRSYLRYWCESFRLPSWPIDDLVARTEVVGEDRIRGAMAEGRGVVCALPHTANWDWAGAWACAEVAPLLTVAERLRPERLYDEFVAYRRGLGMEILPLGGEDTVRRLESWLREGGLVCLLADRDLSRSGVEVTLAGESARMPRGPAELSRRTGAALIPVTLHYDGDRMVVTFHERIADAPVEQMMQGVADVFTEALRAHPLDWHMMQRVFTADLDPQRSPS